MVYKNHSPWPNLKIQPISLYETTQKKTAQNKFILEFKILKKTIWQFFKKCL